MYNEICIDMYICIYVDLFERVPVFLYVCMEKRVATLACQYRETLAHENTSTFIHTHALDSTSSEHAAGE